MPPPPPVWTRRRVLGTGAAVLGAGAGALALLRHVGARHEPTPAVLELMRRASLAQREGIPGQNRQAVAFYKQATEQDPNYAPAWGALALAYRHLLEGFGDAEFASLPGLIRSAAGRALALDPDNADAQVALVIIKPYYRNWLVLERELGPLAQRWPDHWLLQAQRGLLLQEVGRFDEAIVFHQRVNAIDPFLPVSHAFLTRAFSLARRIQEADATIDAALRRWPAHPMLWQMRFNVYLYSARPGAAAAFVQSPDNRPDAVTQTDIDQLLLLARAAMGRRPPDVAAAVAFLRTMARDEPLATPSVAAQLGLFGQTDLMFAALERYYFGRGGDLPPIAPPGRYDRRSTAALFAPPVMPYRADPRHAALFERVGLERYWRESGSRPDFRRA